MRPANTNTRLSLLAVAVTILGCVGSAWSQEVALPANTAPTAAPAPVTPPARGITMGRVESQFGAPAERHAAVGNPPITRWDYPSFSVFFEHQHVIHSVVR